MADISRARRAIASGSAVFAAGLASRIHEPGFTWTLRIPIALLLVSALAIHVRRLEAQVLARALWFATALLAASSFVLPLGVPREITFGLMVTMVGALAAAGRRGLLGDATSGKFEPAAFRAPLLASVGMALVDVHALLFFGVAAFERYDAVSLPLILGGLLTAAAVGVYRLRVVAVLAMFGLNATVLAAAVTGALWVPPPLAVMLMVTSLIQLVLPIPMLRVIAARARALGKEHERRVAENAAIASEAPSIPLRLAPPDAVLEGEVEVEEDALPSTRRLLGRL